MTYFLLDDNQKLMNYNFVIDKNPFVYKNMPYDIDLLFTLIIKNGTLI